jgi:hypothetical protein
MNLAEYDCCNKLLLWRAEKQRDAPTETQKGEVYLYLETHKPSFRCGSVAQGSPQMRNLYSAKGLLVK